MKNTTQKVLTIIFIIVILPLVGLGVFALFNLLVAYKTATGNDWINFTGGIIGSLIAGLIALVTVYATIKNGNKNHQKANDLQNTLNVKNNNIQMALKVEDNLTRKMETERAILTTAYNHLENFLFTVCKIVNHNYNYLEIKNDLLRLYKEFFTSTNNIRFNSEIYIDRSMCENCSMCEIKTYGILVKDATNIQKELSIIDDECRIVLTHFESALDTANKSRQLLEEKADLQRVNINNESIISIRQSQVANPITLPQQQTYSD